MTFSITAAGDKEQTLGSLRELTVYDNLGLTVRDALVMAIESSADHIGGLPVTYSVEASGHSGMGTVPSLAVSLSAEASAPEPTQENPPPQTPAQSAPAEDSQSSPAP